MDPVSLAAVITATILPKALPYLLKLGGSMGDSFAKQAEEKFGPVAWETAQSIWSKIGGKLQGKPEGQVAVEDVAKNPEDEDNVASLRKEIRKTFEEDPALTADVEKVVDERIKVDINLRNIKGKVTGVKMEGVVTSADVKIQGEDVEDGGEVTGVDIKKI
jgi:hypothetical protein